MALEEALRSSFERSFTLYRDLAAMLDAELLAAQLPGLPSNSIGGQLWCVVGARESYSRAIEAGAWQGFTSSLDRPHDPAQVETALQRSEEEARGVLRRLPELDERASGVLLDLLEHEAQHQGQLIRYLYGLRLEIPASWKAKYALD